MADGEELTLIEQIVACFEHIDWEGLADRYAPDVLLDMNLPAWRFQLQGREVVRQYLLEQVNGLTNLRCTHHRAYPTDDGVIVEDEIRFDRDDGEGLWRAVEIFHVANDAIVEHTQYCTGSWTADDIDRHETEAPMVRW